MLSLGTWCLGGSALAQAPATPSPEALRAERRVNLVKLWGEVRFRHPWAFSKPAEWDAAFMAALPRVEAAQSAEAYADAVQSMLAALGDPATLVARKVPPPAGAAPTLRALKSWEKDVLVLDLRHLNGPEGYASMQELQKTLDADAAKARAVVLDLRMRGLQGHGVFWMVPQLLPHLIEGELRVPGQRRVQHTGLKAQDGSERTYWTEFTFPADELITGTAGKKPALLVFLVDEDSGVHQSILALRAAGKGRVVAEGPLDDGATNAQDSVPLGEGHRALVSVTEPLLPVETDVKLPLRARMDGPDEGMRQALALATRPPKRRPVVAVRPAAAWRPEPPYKEALYPSREMRLLAGAKLWAVVHFFFPYKHLMDRPWESRLPALLEKLEAAKDAKEYVLTLAEAGTWLQDGHVAVGGHPELGRFFGRPPPVWVTDIDGKAVVLELSNPQATPGLAVGDIIETVDGEPIDTRARRLAPYVSASTSAAHREMTLMYALAGEPGSSITLGVRGAKGPRVVEFPRVGRGMEPPSKEAPYRVLEGNVGFVDLGKLEAWQVPEMFEKLKDTRGIVFDLRAYPRGSMWALGPYFNVKGNRPFCQYEYPRAGGESSNRMKREEAVPDGDTPKYRGRTVTLIDTRAMSQAEHMGLLLETAAETLFVGSPTAGYNGNITHAVLPGGIRFYMTGLEVRHGDGRQLQRKGLEPHVKVRPTVAGLQAGRDELLERAVQLLRAEPSNKAAARQP